MRRLTAAFAKRDKQPHQPHPSQSPEPPARSPTKKSSGFFARTQVKLDPSAVPPVPALIRPGPSTPGSSSSSDASSSIKTPDDDPPHARHHLPPTKWPVWITRRRQPTSPSATMPVVDQVRPPSMPPPRHDHPADDTDDDSDRYSSASSFTSVAFPTTTPGTRGADRARAQSNLRALVQSGLDSAPSSSHPLLNGGAGTAFPRSCNSAAALHTQPTVLATLHRNRLLRKLDARGLNASEQASILPFAYKAKSALARPRAKRPDEAAVFERKRLVGHCRGLRQWMMRPTFEQRVVDWHSSSTSRMIMHRPIQGTALPVAELEFSNGLLALAGLNDLSPLGSPLLAVGRSSPTPPADMRELGMKASGYTPSQRLQSSQTSRTLKTAGTAAQADPAGSNATRAHVDLNDDDTPLDVLALTLRARRERDLRQKQLLDGQQRKAKEEERRAREDEKQRKAFADEVSAARLRRERHRSGGQLQGSGFINVEESGPGRPATVRGGARRTASELDHPSAPFSSGASSTSATRTDRHSSGPFRGKSGRSESASPQRTSTVGSRSSVITAPPFREDLSAQAHAHEPESGARQRRNSDTRRTLPRSFKPDAPPMPSLPRAHSQPQVPITTLPPVHKVPPVPLYANHPSPLGPRRRPNILDPRLSVSMDRLSLYSMAPSRAHIQ